MKEKIEGYIQEGKIKSMRKRKAQEMEEAQDGVTVRSDLKSDPSDTSEVEDLSERRKKRRREDVHPDGEGGHPKDDIENDADDESLEPRGAALGEKAIEIRMNQRYHELLEMPARQGDKKEISGQDQKRVVKFKDRPLEEFFKPPSKYTKPADNLL